MPEFHYEFVAWLELFPALKGNNSLSVTSTTYGINLSRPEYTSSWIQGVYEAFIYLINLHPLGENDV